jgi:hypothetical protein
MRQVPQPQKFLTSRAFVAHVNELSGIGLTLSRFRKDRMKDESGASVAPEPVARFGNRDLFDPDQAPPYIARLIKPAEQRNDQAARTAA